MARKLRRELARDQLYPLEHARQNRRGPWNLHRPCIFPQKGQEDLYGPSSYCAVRQGLRASQIAPLGGERTIWSDGIDSDLQIIATLYGRGGILECWEHFHPAMTFNMQAQAETLHLASWPCMSNVVLVEQGMDISVVEAKTLTGRSTVTVPLFQYDGTG